MRSLRVLLPAIVFWLTLLGLPAPGLAQTDPHSWTGEWQTYWRDSGALMVLTQEGDAVTGTYDPGDGRVEGRLEGQVFSGQWFQDGVSGSFVFALSADGRTFTGRFDSGEYWNGQRLDTIPDDGARFSSASSPRETLRTVMAAANEAMLPGDVATLRFLERYLSYEASDTGARERNRRRTLIWRILNLSTFRVYGAPPRPAGDTAVYRIGPADSRVHYDLPFIRDESGSWRVLVETEAKLEAVLERFLDALGYDTIEKAEDARRHSPRGTMYDFIIGTHEWNGGGQQRVLGTLDLSFLPPQLRAPEGAILADYLKQIIDRAGFVIWQEIPDDPNRSTPYVHYEHPMGRVVIDRVAGEAEGQEQWKFTAETLRNAPVLYAAIQDLPPARGIANRAPMTRLFKAREWIRTNAPGLLHRGILLENWQWLALCTVFVLSVLAAWLVALALQVVMRLARSSKWLHSEDGFQPETFAWPLRLSTWGIVLNALLGQLGIVAASFDFVFRAVAIVTVIAVAWLCYKLVHAVGSAFMHRAAATRAFADEIVTSLATGLVKLAVIVGAIVVCADITGLPYEGVIAGLGVGGLALAFAARETVSNLLGGALLLADRPFKRGDLIETDGQLAVIHDVGLRSTRLRRLDDTIMIIPNAQLSDKAIVNWGMRRRRRVDLPIGVPYGTPRDKLDAFVDALKELFLSQPDAEEEDLYVALKEFGDSAIGIECRGFFRVRNYEEQIRARHALVGDVIDLAEKMGVSFAFPTRTVHLLNAPPEGEEERGKEEETQAG